MGVNILARNENDVASLQTALHYGESSLKTIPVLIKNVIRNESWRERVHEGTGEILRCKSFAEFVSKPIPEGLHADIKTLQRLCGDDLEALDLLDQAVQNPVGVHACDVSIRNITERPAGTTEQYALRKLRKDRQDLHERVLSGELSAHAAMVEAGFRPKTVTVKTEAAAFAHAARKHLTDDQIDELIELLESDD